MPLIWPRVTAHLIKPGGFSVFTSQVREKRGPDLETELGIFEQIRRFVEPLDRILDEDYEGPARQRIEIRDPDDWPVVAVMLGLPIGTEDQDLFGRERRPDLDDGSCRGVPHRTTRL